MAKLNTNVRRIRIRPLEGAKSIHDVKANIFAHWGVTGVAYDPRIRELEITFSEDNRDPNLQMMGVYDALNQAGYRAQPTPRARRPKEEQK